MERLSKKQIEENLRVYGFKLGWSSDESIERKVDVEELIIDVLKGVDEPRYINGLPVVIAKNMDSLRFDYLAKRAQEEGVVNAVGWILEEAKEAFERTRASHVPELEKTIEKLEENRTRSDTFIGNDRSQAYLDYAIKRRNELQKKWGIVDPYTAHEFDRLLRIYKCLPP